MAYAKALPRFMNRGLIEADYTIITCSTVCQLPRFMNRGLIEASSGRIHACIPSGALPRFMNRGLIEATWPDRSRMVAPNFPDS